MSAAIMGRALLKQGRAADADAPLERVVALRRALHAPQTGTQLAAVQQALEDARRAASERTASMTATRSAAR